MERITISALYADAEQLGGQKVTVAGWVRSVRDMKNFGFVTLNDGSCFKDLQVVMNRENLGNYEEVASCGVGAALIIEGVLELTPDRPQPIELQAQTIECRRSVSRLSTFVRSSIFVLAPTCSVQSSASVLWLLLLSTSSSRTAALST